MVLFINLIVIDFNLKENKKEKEKKLKN